MIQADVGCDIGPGALLARVLVGNVPLRVTAWHGYWSHCMWPAPRCVSNCLCSGRLCMASPASRISPIMITFVLHAGSIVQRIGEVGYASPTLALVEDRLLVLIAGNSIGLFEADDMAGRRLLPSLQVVRAWSQRGRLPEPDLEPVTESAAVEHDQLAQTGGRAQSLKLNFTWIECTDKPWRLRRAAHMTFGAKRPTPCRPYCQVHLQIHRSNSLICLALI